MPKFWVRKTDIENTTGKHVTLGSTVRATCARFGAGPSPRAFIPAGTVGKVLESGTANGYAAKRWTGTKAAMLVEWELP